MKEVARINNNAKCELIKWDDHRGSHEYDTIMYYGLFIEEALLDQVVELMRISPEKYWVTTKEYKELCLTWEITEKTLCFPSEEEVYSTPYESIWKETQKIHEKLLQLSSEEREEIFEKIPISIASFFWNEGEDFMWIKKSKTRSKRNPGNFDLIEAVLLHNGNYCTPDSLHRDIAFVNELITHQEQTIRERTQTQEQMNNEAKKIEDEINREVDKRTRGGDVQENLEKKRGLKRR